MSALYKDREDIIYSVCIKFNTNGKINLLFSCDGGKFGTDEMLAEYDLSPLELLKIIQESENDK
jgi:hypothetical protein